MRLRALVSRTVLVPLTAFLSLSSALAAEAPLSVSDSFDLSTGNYHGTFFQLMSRESNGIKASLDADYGTPVKVVDVQTFRERSTNFSNLKNLERKLGGANALNTLIDDLSGKEIPEDKMWSAVMGSMRKNDLNADSRVAGALIPIIAIASGKGVLVQLDKENYVYNYGYAVGSGGSDLEADKTNRKTGRSYGASISRNAYDPSDNDYLRELALYTGNADEQELSNFYRTVFSILLKSDTSGIQNLSADGQTVVADFMAIYMAELDRHLMTGLKRYEWENALTEITMLGAFSASEDGVTLDPRGGPSNDNERGLVESSELETRDRLVGFFGVGTDGSGLDGRNKQRRHNLTKKITAAVRESDEKLVSNIEELLNINSTSDIYDKLMDNVNAYKTQSTIRKNADKLIDAAVDFVMATHSHARDLK